MNTDLENELSRRLHALTPEPPADFRYEPRVAGRRDDAGPVDRVPLDILPARRPARARRWWAPVLVAALVAGIAATAAIWLPRTSPEDAGSGSVPYDPVRTLPFTLPASSGLVLLEAGTGIALGSEHPGSGEDALLKYQGRTEVTLHLSSDTLEHTRSVQGSAQSLHPVQVNGRPGYAGQVSGSATVFWAYRTGQIAEMIGTGNPSVDTLLTIARAVAFTDRTLLTTPLRVSRAPAGMKLSALSTNSGDLWNGYFSYVTPDHARIVQVYAYPGNDDPSALPGTKYCEIRHADGVVHVCATGTANMTTSALKAILKTVRIAPHPGDVDTWFDPTTALP